MKEATKRKISISHTGLKQTPETKAKIRRSMLLYWEEVKETNAVLQAAGFDVKRRSHSPETKRKIKASAKGRKFSPLAKQKLKEYQQNKKADAQLKARLTREQKGVYDG